MSTFEKLQYSCEEHYPDFELQEQFAGTGTVASLTPRPCRDWYSSFRDRIMDRLGSGIHTPVYRISHGEFWFMCGHRPVPGTGIRGLMSFAWMESRRRLGIAPQIGYAKTNNSGERLTAGEVKRAMPDFVRQIRSIAENGFLAPALHHRPTFQEYIEPTCRWLDEQSIPFHEDNYVPFYAVYVLLCGPQARAIFDGRRVLIVTSLNEEKRERLENTLRDFGAISVELLAVSRNKALFDKLDLSKVREKPDVVLAGGGIGTSNLLEQVAPLGAVAIDSGFATDVYAYPEKRGIRPYTLPDADFDPGRIGFLTPERMKAMQARWAQRRG